MRLSELLSRLQIDHLVEIAMNCGIVCGIHSKRQLIRAIQDNFRRPEFLRHVIDRWNDRERATLAYLLLAPEWVWKTQGEQVSRAVFTEQKSWEDPYIRKLERYGQTIRSHGFLLPVDGRRSEESDWIVPEDLRAILEEIVLGNQEQKDRALQGEPDSVLKGGQAFLEDLFTLLIYACKDTLRLTQKGELFRKARTFLNDFFLAREEKCFDRLPTIYPGRLEFMIGFVQRFQILVVSGRSLVPTKNLEGWMLKPDLEKYTDLYHYLKRILIAGDPGCRQIIKQLEEQEKSEGWKPLNGPNGICFEQISGEPWWLEEVRSRIYWLFHCLMNLGLVELGRWEPDGELGFRWLPLGLHLIQNKEFSPDLSAPLALTLQPDFEVFAPRDISLDKRWQLERIADLVSRDVVFRYRITKESVYRGLKWNTSLKRILEFLEEYSPKGVPQNVVQDLETWTEQYGKITFADVLLMRCKSKQIAQELRLSPEIAPLIRGEITPQDLIISRKDYDRILNLLERTGHMPKPGILTFDDNLP